ncbi:MAG: dTDP-4-dehydrorhamnose 3,5-epimerase [Defluviitaleaceae bacterium]|nr:dTDP-4-dehydrorhamnose 3,5-epimerase [Defluviitaleaceae bacterium]
MCIKELSLKGVYLIEPNFISDNRGFFSRTFCKNEFSKMGLATEFPQWSISHNKKKNTIRGMHFQKPPHEEIKLITCTKGGIYDVLVDLREGSETYKKWISVELTETNKHSLYVPGGIAHGFKTLLDDTDVFYHISEFYHPEYSSGVLYNDEAFGIEWGNLDGLVISEKDLAWTNSRTLS